MSVRLSVGKSKGADKSSASHILLPNCLGMLCLLSLKAADRALGARRTLVQDVLPIFWGPAFFRLGDNLGACQTGRLSTMRTNYVLVDYENVQPASFDGLNGEHFKVYLFVGASQTKVAFEIAEMMQALGVRAQYVKIAGNGPNALDFHIAFYIGQLSVADPAAYFHIISKDTGFDPLIRHLKLKKLAVQRSRSIDDIPMLKATSSKSPVERAVIAVANLKQRGAAKPRTLKTLTSTLSSLFQNQLTENELDELLAELQRTGIVTITERKVSYAMPASEG